MALRGIHPFSLDSRMQRSPARHAFTLIEMLTVMLVIAILAGIVLSVNGLVQSKAARARTEGEIKSLSLSCENYKSDNGTYPRSDDTDALDARVSSTPTTAAYQKASQYLYLALSGDTNLNGKQDPDEPKGYAQDFFKPNVLNFNKDGSGKIVLVNYIKDPFDNSYGYSTAGAAAEEKFVEDLRKNPTATRPGTLVGYNPTFDLWSTAGATGTTAVQAKWVKNW
jgi:prepilin-type N-terminal cleavage/methylation domain-containing protein